MNRRIRLTSALALSVVAGFMVAGTAMASSESPKVAGAGHQVSAPGVQQNVPAPALRDGYGKDDKKDHDGYEKDHDGYKKDHGKHEKYKHYKKPHGHVHAGDGSLAQK